MHQIHEIMGKSIHEESWKSRYRGIWFEITNYHGVNPLWGYLITLRKKLFADHELWRSIWNGGNPTLLPSGEKHPFWGSLQMPKTITDYEADEARDAITFGRHYEINCDRADDNNTASILLETAGIIDIIHEKYECYIDDMGSVKICNESDGVYRDGSKSQFFSYESLKNGVWRSFAQKYFSPEALAQAREHGAIP